MLGHDGSVDVFDYEDTRLVKRSKFCIFSATVVGLFYLAMIIVMMVGWSTREPLPPPAERLSAVFQLYTDDTCTLGSALPTGPCWEGEGAGYEGFFWYFTCDKEYRIYESQCSPTGCNLTECQTPHDWGDIANTCSENVGSFYRYTCIEPIS